MFILIRFPPRTFPYLYTALTALAVSLGGCAVPGSQVRDNLKEDLLHMPGNFWQDSKMLVTQPRNAAILLIGGAASGYVRYVHDHKIEDYFQGRHTFRRDFNIGVGAAGNPLTHFALAGSGYMYGLVRNDLHTRQVSGSLLEALALDGLITLALKGIARDHCPNDEYYAWPSGHTSSSIAFATVMNEYYGPRIGLPLYALSGFVMYERMETGEHWASDVVFGAALGYVIGKTVADRYKPQIFDMEITPFFSPELGVSGLALKKRF